MSASGGAFMYWYLHAHTIHIVHPYQPTSSAQRAATVTILLGGTVQQWLPQIRPATCAEMSILIAPATVPPKLTANDRRINVGKALGRNLTLQKTYGTGIRWRAIPFLNVLSISPGRQHEIAISIPSCEGGTSNWSRDIIAHGAPMTIVVNFQSPFTIVAAIHQPHLHRPLLHQVEWRTCDMSQNTSAQKRTFYW